MTMEFFKLIRISKSLLKGFYINFGSLAYSIAEQIKKQNFNCNVSFIHYCERAYIQMHDLHDASLISDSEVRKIEKRLFNKITKHLKDENKS